jgi:ABC-type Fe3+ transport system permease subunit
MLAISAPLIVLGVVLYMQLAESVVAARWAPPVWRGGARQAALVALLLSPALLLRSLSVLYAFSNEWLRSPLPSLGVKPWRQLLVMPDMLRAAVNSGVYAALVVTVMLLLITYAAWYSRINRRVSAVLTALFTLPVLVPGIVVAYGLYMVFSGCSCPLNPLENPVPLLLLGYYARRSPLLFHAALAVARSVPRSLYEAARAVGAGPLRAYAAIVAPLMFSRLVAPAVYTGLSIAGEVSLSVTLGGLAGSEGATHPAPLMYLVASYMGLSGLKYAAVAAAASLVAYMLAALLSLVALFLINFLVSRKSYG